MTSLAAEPIGCRVVLKTVFDEEVAGTIFAFDASTGCLVLKQAGTHGGVSNLRLLRESSIKVSGVASGG